MDTKVKKKLLLAILISAGFSVILLYRIDLNHFREIAGRMDIKELIAAYGVFLLGNLVRTFRFYKLDHMNNKLLHWWYMSAFYNFITASLPGGAGEAATAYVLKRFSKINILGALRILLLSRLLDMFAVSVLFFITAVIIGGVASYREAAIWLSAGMFIISSVTLLPSSEQFAVRLLKKIPGNSDLMKRLNEKLNELIKISEEQRSNNTLPVTLFQSVLMWIGGIVMLNLVLRSFGIDFTTVQCAYCFGVYAIFQIVPVQGIAGIGTQAAWWALGLNAAGYQGLDAVALGFVLHGIFFLFISSLGIISVSVWFAENKRSSIPGRQFKH